VTHVPARDAVVDVVGRELHGGRDDDGAEAHRGQHGLPEGHDVGQHDEHVVARATP